MHLTGIYHLLLRSPFWRTRKGEFWFMPWFLYLVNNCIRENLIANIRCSIEPLLDPDLYFGWQRWRNGAFFIQGRYDIVMSWAELRVFFFRKYYTSLLLLIVMCVWFLIQIHCITFPAVFSSVHTVTLFVHYLQQLLLDEVVAQPTVGLEVSHGSHLETSDQLLVVFAWKCSLFYIAHLLPSQSCFVHKSEFWNLNFKLKLLEILAVLLVFTYMLSTCLDLFLYFGAVSADSSCRSSVSSFPCSTDRNRHFHPRQWSWYEGLLVQLGAVPWRAAIGGITFFGFVIISLFNLESRDCCHSKNLILKLSYLKIYFFSMYVKYIRFIQKSAAAAERGKEEVFMWQGLFVFHQLCSQAFYLHSW